MIRTICHGSDHIIERPVFGAGKKYNDYGRGFYSTEDLDAAKEWGVVRDAIGYADRYAIDTDGLSILELNDSRYCILHWLTMLIQNREFDVSAPLTHQAKAYLLKTFRPEDQEYDCIIGYRAQLFLVRTGFHEWRNFLSPVESRDAPWKARHAIRSEKQESFRPRHFSRL